MKAWLIQIDAWNGAVAVPVRMASHDDERLCNLDGQTWWPVIEKLPTLRYDFFDGSFDAASITSPTGSFDVAIEAIPSLPTLAIHDARIRVWGGELGDAFAAFTLTFDGRVKEQPTVSDGSMSISIGADDSWLDQPLLKTYAGTGAAEGGTDLEGQVKPLALGAPRFAPATLVDAVDNIYQLSGYGPLQLVETAFERLNRFGAVAGNAGNFAGLKAGEVKRGEWATCLAEGFVKFGAPPEQPLSFHVRGDAQGGWSRLPGDLCRRVAELAGGVAKVAAADVAALNVARPWPLSIMVTAQTTARDLIQRIAMSVNAVAYIDWLGMLRLAAVGIGTASLTMAADGSALPPVSEVQQVETNAPYWKIAQGAAVTWQVHGLNDIAFSAPLNPRGPYDATESYREGDMVTLPNGSQWLFIGTTPATGSAPADDNANWFRLSDAITAGNITYEDGTKIEDLKPATPNATQGSTVGVDLYLPEIRDIPAPPGLLRNDFLDLRADGTLAYSPYGDPAVQEELGRITPVGIGAAEDSARRQLENAVDRLGAALLQVQSEASRTRTTLRDAGVYIDPANGTVKIAAIEQTAERVSEAYIRLSAAESSIVARATFSDVSSAIAKAVLDPTQIPIFEGIELTISEVELRLNAAEGAIALKADTLTVDDHGLRLGDAEIAISSLEGKIESKVESTTFDALGERVTSAEQTLEAIGDGASIRQAVIAARQFPDAAAGAHESALRALLAGDLSRRQTFDAVAAARSELTAAITDDRAAFVRSRQELIVRIGAAEASALTETELRIEGQRAVARMVTDLTVSLDGQLAGFDERIVALVDNDALILASLTQTVSAVRGLGEDAASAAESALLSLLTGDKTGRVRASEIAAARQELTAKITADVEAVAQRVYAVLARMGAAEASIVSIEIARATANLAIVSRLNQMTATINENSADIRTEESARAEGDEAQASRTDDIMARIGEQGDEGSIEARIASAAIAFVDPLAAQAEFSQDISARLGTPDTPASLEARLEEARTAYVTPLGAVAEFTDEISARLGTPDTPASLEARLAAAATAYVGEAEAQALRTDEVEARLGVKDAPGSIEARIASAANAYATPVEAIAQFAQDISARLGEPNTPASLEARLDAAATAYVGEAEAQAQRIDGVEARLGVAGSEESVEARITRAADAYVTPLEAEALRVDTLETTVGGHSASVEEFAESINGLKVRAGFRLTAGKKIIGWVANNDGDEGGLDFVVDYFRIWNAAGSTFVAPFAYAGGKFTLTANVEIDGNLNVKNGTLTADKFEANGVTRTYESANADTIALTNSMSDVVTLSIEMTRPGTIIVMAAYQFVFPAGGAWAAAILVNDAQLQAGSNDIDHYASFMRSYQVAAPGTYVVKARAARTAGSVSINAGGTSLLVLRTYT